MAPAPVSRFERLDLRTTDVDSGAAFYAEVLGATDGGGGKAGGGGATRSLTSPSGEVGRVVPLPEQARTRGAPAHWLGCLGVDDVESVADRIARAGGRHLSPLAEPDGGGSGAVVRDPGGAVLGLIVSSSAHGTPETPEPTSRPVTWHELHTPDPEGMWTLYRELFGWVEAERADLGGELGPYRTFGWQPDGEATGGVADTSRRPHVHPHWLFYFAVDDLAASTDAVRAEGGTLLGEPLRGPGGFRVTVALDPQGAIFGLAERTS